MAPRIRPIRRHLSAKLALAAVLGSLALGIPALAVAGGPDAPTTVPAHTSKADASSTDRVVVCDTPTESVGDVRVSNETATRVDPGAPLPDGCREG